MTHFFSFILPIVFSIVILPAQAAQSDEIEEVATARLVELYIREARSMTMMNPITKESILVALNLLKRCAELQPENQSVWQAMVEVATMAEDDALVSECIQSLLRLSPNSPALQLARIRNAIESLQTAPERIRVYDRLLSPQEKVKLDSQVASRLAHDAALLYRSLGDTDSFAVWLAESIALDPANQSALALGVGFFGDETADPIQRIELLGAAALANPFDVTYQIQLAEFLLAYGDYQSARRLYDYILNGDAGDTELISDGLLADIVLSQWADGDPIAGLDAVLTRQIEVDRVYRQSVKAQQPRMTPLELARIHAPLAPKLATIRAAIYAELDDASSAEISLEAAADTCALLGNIYKQRESNESVLSGAESYLQAAWLTLWLGSDVTTAQDFLNQSSDIAMMSTEEQQRFNGWIALRSGDVQLALDLLTPLAELPISDPAAQAGVALALQSIGQLKESAKVFLNIARMQGGTILGVWARNRLQAIVGSSFDVRDEVALLRPLADQIIDTFDLIRSDPRPPFSLRVEPIKTDFKTYEPIIVDIEIKNNTTLPLTIDRNGAIQPLVLIEANIELSTASIQNAPGMIVPVNKSISIPSRGTVTFKANLREYWLGSILNMFPLHGASIHLRSIANFSARQTTKDGRTTLIVYEPSRTGIRYDSTYFRVNGFRLTDVWLEQAFATAEELNSADALTMLSLLSFVINDEVVVRIVVPPIPPDGDEEQPVPTSPMRVPLQDEAATLILSSFPKLGPLAQAWYVSAMAEEPSIQAVLGMAETTNNIDAQLSWILRFNNPNVPDEALDDPTILNALHSESPLLKSAAKWMYNHIQKIIKERAELELALPAQ